MDKKTIKEMGLKYERTKEDAKRRIRLKAADFGSFLRDGRGPRSDSDMLGLTFRFGIAVLDETNKLIERIKNGWNKSRRPKSKRNK